MSDPSNFDTVELPPVVIPEETQPPPQTSSRVTVDVAALSHAGKVRPNNEDHFILARFSRSAETLDTNLPKGSVPKHFHEKAYALVVADGMGGMAAGEIASSLALSAGMNLSLHNPKWTLRMSEDEAREYMERARQRMRQVDRVVSDKANEDPDLAGMGTTLTGAYSVGADLFLFHVGDSRAYLFRGGKLERLTHDHTMAQALADVGIIDPEEVKTHRLHHVLTKAVGIHGGEVEADLEHRQLMDGDRLLLCTDGLTEMVEAAKIAEALRQHERSEDACRVLVDLALEGGGRDNVTVVVARYTIPDDAPGGPPP
jgi:serine/threonine protein phosphatase PrpC